ncbi:MAG TPA: helix-turn-helix domain-containing protein [Bryobacteraceae bacterium]|nr:helix-turn-helix domain-containing protein [Bryobacteraceae bacterium]
MNTDPWYSRRRSYLKKAGRIEVGNEPDPAPDWIHRMPERIREIVVRAASEYGVSIRMVLSGMHERPIVLARRLAIHRIRKLAVSTPQIGRWLGMHHSSIVYHLQKPCPRGRRLPEDYELGDGPDESGIWAI